MANSYTFESGHVCADCCGSADCEQCRGDGHAQLTGHDALLGAVALLADDNVVGHDDNWAGLLVEMDAQTRAAMAELGRLRRQLRRLAQDALATVSHLERHFPEVGSLLSVQETKQRAEQALGRGNVVATVDVCRRVASEVR